MLKIEVNRQTLISYLSVVSKGTGTNLDLLVLNSILISAEKESSLLSLTSTNLNQAIISSIPAKIVSEGSIAIPAKIVFEFLSSIEDEIVSIEELKNLKLKISTRNHNSTIYLTDTSDFPELPTIPNTESLDLNADILKEALTKVSFASSKDETRPVLNGVLAYTNTDQTLTLVATDSYRLAEKTINFNSKEEISELRSIIPTQTIQDLLKIFPLSSSEEVKVYIENDQIGFVIDNVTLISRLVSGDYPEYKNLIPPTSDTNIFVDRRELLQSVKIASIFAKESAGTIYLEVDKDDNSLKINSVANQVGENFSQIAISTDSNGSININSRYLIEALNSFSEEVLDIRFSKGLAPFVIEPHGNSESSRSLHLIMPINS